LYVLAAFPLRHQLKINTSYAL